MHAFTGEGISNWQLRSFLFVFVVPALILFFNRYKAIPAIVKEEQTSSREFWMFIGSLVLFLAAVSIIIMTSIPVFNKLVSFVGGGKSLIKPLAIGEDAAFAYNRIQVFVAVVIGLLTAVSQYLKYKSTPAPFFTKKILWPTVAAVLIAALIFIFGNINYPDHGIGYLGAVWLAIASAVYAVVANAGYIWLGMKGRLKVSGGSIAHMGFGLMLVGILISSSKKEILSYNTSGIYIPFDPESNKSQAKT